MYIENSCPWIDHLY